MFSMVFLFLVFFYLIHRLWALHLPKKLLGVKAQFKNNDKRSTVSDINPADSTDHLSPALVPWLADTPRLHLLCLFGRVILIGFISSLFLKLACSSLFILIVLPAVFWVISPEGLRALLHLSSCRPPPGQVMLLFSPDLIKSDVWLGYNLQGDKVILIYVQARS